MKVPCKSFIFFFTLLQNIQTVFSQNLPTDTITKQKHTKHNDPSFEEFSLDRNLLLTNKSFSSNKVRDDFTSVSGYTFKQIGQSIRTFIGSVATNAAGDRILIFAPGGFDEVGSPPASKVFQLKSDTNCANENQTRSEEKCWIQIGQTLEVDMVEDHKYGRSVSMNDDGDRIVIGAIGEIGGMKVKAFMLTTDSSVCENGQDECWMQLGDSIDGEQDENKFGWPLAMSGDGDSIIVGAPAPYFHTGAYAEVYKLHTGSTNCGEMIDCWKMVGEKITLEGKMWDMAVSMNQAGDTLIVGLTQPQEAMVFRLSNSSCESNVDECWKQLGQSIDKGNPDSNPSTSTRTGHAVAMNGAGDRIIVGSPFRDSGTKHSGEARVFQLSNVGCDPGFDECWEQLGQRIVGEKIYDKFGYAVTMNKEGDLVAISAPYTDVNELKNVGEVKVFTLGSTACKSGTSCWKLVGKKTVRESDRSRGGYSMAMSSSGMTIVTGDGEDVKPGNGQINPNGQVRVHDLNPRPFSCTDSPKRFILNNKKRRCKWLNQNSGKFLSKRCSKKGVSSHCPKTCAVCGKYICKDSEVSFQLNNAKTCNWVSDNIGRCGSKAIKETCRDTCGYCDE